MAEHQTTVFRGPETPEAFLADRQRFWDSWTKATQWSVVSLVVLLVLMALFLL